MKYKKITWKELETKLNLEIEEFKDLESNEDRKKDFIEYLTYLKSELEVELFISKSLSNN